MKKKELMEFKTQAEFDRFTTAQHLPGSSELLSFYLNYYDYWSGWRFWLLP